MRLPAVAGKYPIPSTPMLGDLPKAYAGADAVTGEWQVDALPLGVSDMLRLRGALLFREPSSPDGRFLAHGVMAALDLCYMMGCVSLAASMLERGRFLPDIRMSDDGLRYEPVWSPVFMGDDAARFKRMEAMMPRVIRENFGMVAAARRVSLRDIFSVIIDGTVRLAWSERGTAGMDTASREIANAIVKNTRAAGSPALERKRRGRFVSALNPHALWIRSLGWLGETEGLSQILSSIYRETRDWKDRYEWFEHAPFKMIVRILEGRDVDDAWRLEYALRATGVAGAVIPAKAVWNGKSASCAYMRRYFLLMLGRMGAMFRPIRDSLENPAPEGCVLPSREAADFLGKAAPELLEIGVEVVYPKWWAGSHPRDMLSIMCVRGASHKYEWKVALNGAAMTDEELRAITSGGPLIKIRGEWIFLPAELLDEMAIHIAGLPTEVSAADVVKLAIRDPVIGGFSGLPEEETIYAALSRRAPPEILSAPESMKGELRPYQCRGYSWLAFLSGLGIGACLADDMGLGKTLQTLSLVQRYRDAGDLRPVLLICPTSIIENWRAEMRRFFPSMTFYVHHGHERLRGEKFAKEAARSAMVLSSYSLLYRDSDLYREIDWLGIVLDEAQNIKNPDTRQARAVRTVKSGWRVALTGTPIENHVGDLWSIMEFLMPGMLGSRRSFMNTYVKPLAREPDARLADSLRRVISPLVLRRLKTDPDIAPDLPEKIQTKEFCLLKKEQVKLYSAVAAELTNGLGYANGIKRKGMVLAGLTKMKQICGHPALFLRDGDYDAARSSKLERFLSLAGEMFDAGGRTLVFTQYVEMGNILKYQLQEHFGREAFFLHGGVPRDGRDKMVRDFERGSGPQFFVLSLRAGGVGLNLARANHVVMYDRWWNPAVEAQAIDRAYRIGQTRNVQVHIFCCKGTLEERIDDLITSKRRLADSVIQVSDDWVTELSDCELKYLVSMSMEAAE